MWSCDLPSPMEVEQKRVSFTIDAQLQTWKGLEPDSWGKDSVH